MQWTVNVKDIDSTNRWIEKIKIEERELFESFVNMVAMMSWQTVWYDISHTTALLRTWPHMQSRDAYKPEQSK